jgi:hypothetical protein
VTRWGWKGSGSERSGSDSSSNAPSDLDSNAVMIIPKLESLPPLRNIDGWPVAVTFSSKPYS